MTAEVYSTHVDRIRSQLTRAWANDERVLALKLAIAASKLMGETGCPEFYPQQFVHSADLLDLFGYPAGVRSLSYLDDTKPVWADSCSVGLRASPSFQRWRSEHERMRS